LTSESFVATTPHRPLYSKPWPSLHLFNLRV
jgi:hypothetical protein